MNSSLEHQVELALGCISSDGRVDEVELRCLRSIAVQRGESIEDYDRYLREATVRFQKDPIAFIDGFTSFLQMQKEEIEDQIDQLSVLIELVAADGVTDQGELDYLRLVVLLGGWNMVALIRARPDWEPYLKDGFETRMELRNRVIVRMEEGLNK
jgi:uncharacterized protein YqeY